MLEKNLTNLMSVTISLDMSSLKQENRSDKGLGIYAGEYIRDHLDRDSLDFIESLKEQGVQDIHALDLGGGLGAQTVRMASAGVKVTMVDLLDATDRFQKAVLEGLIGEGLIRMIVKDWRDLNQSDAIRPIDVLYSQRALSYISFTELRSVLAFLSNLLKPHARFYMSFNGMDSLYGEAHPQKNEPVENRFAVLEKDIREKLNAQEPMCVYAREDLDKLFDNLPYEIEQVKQTRFGNYQVYGFFSKV